MRVIPLLALVLTGCYVGPKYKFKHKKSACDSELVERANDLALKVDQGPGDGSFDYDFQDWALLEHTAGSYDLDTGAFSWDNTFATDAMRTSEHAEGVGLIERNGDMDLGYTLTASFKDGTASTHEVRHIRSGCAETLRIADVDDENDVSLLDGSWSEGELSWERNFIEGPVPVVGVGKLRADRSWFETVDFRDGSFQVVWVTRGDGSGHQTREFNDDDGFEKVEGTWERWYAGTVQMLFTRNNPTTKKQTWDFRVEADGNGTGTWEVDGESCQLSFNAFKCRLKNCTDASLEGTCQVPVSWPEF